MRLRYGIPLTLALLALCTWISWLIDRDLYWVLTIGAAAWAALDARQRDLRRFETWFPLEPVGVLLAVSLALPVALPYYLRLQHRAELGVLPLRTSDRNPRALVVLTGLAAGLMLVCSVWQPAGIRALQAVATAVSDRYRRPVNVTINNGSNLTVTFTNAFLGGDSAAARDTFAVSVARFARDHYPKPSSLNSVAVRFLAVHRRGSVTTTRAEQVYKWDIEDIPEASIDSL
jgi:hypothetical protein